MVLYSLYVPGAGFLWTDRSVWDENIGDFVPDEHFVLKEDDVAASQHLAGHRLIFRDKINTASTY